MELGRQILFVSVGLALLGCAPPPAPQPIMPEPVYDKFGVVQIPPQFCIPSDQRGLPASYVRQGLPRCEDRCRPGTQLDGRQSSTTHATSREPICVPIPPQSSGGSNGTSGQIPGTQTGPITRN